MTLRECNPDPKLAGLIEERLHRAALRIARSVRCRYCWVLTALREGIIRDPRNEGEYYDGPDQRSSQ
mgnify:CR=1 FL=1